MSRYCISFFFLNSYLIHVIQKHARGLVRVNLNDALCFTDQEQAKLAYVRDEVNKFPFPNHVN